VVEVNSKGVEMEGGAVEGTATGIAVEVDSPAEVGSPKLEEQAPAEREAALSEERARSGYDGVDAEEVAVETLAKRARLC
jgi:hypothetical protein